MVCSLSACSLKNPKKSVGSALQEKNWRRPLGEPIFFLQSKRPELYKDNGEQADQMKRQVTDNTKKKAAFRLGRLSYIMP